MSVGQGRKYGKLYEELKKDSLKVQGHGERRT
jgi:hypothetical protein